LFLAKVAINGERGFTGACLAQNGLPRGAANDDLWAQVQGIAHEIFARTNLHNAAAEPRHVIHCRLERAVIGAQETRVGLAHRDAGSLRRGRPHLPGQLLFFGWRRPVSLRKLTGRAVERLAEE
jgi:hypothetical protein